MIRRRLVGGSRIGVAVIEGAFRILSVVRSGVSIVRMVNPPL